MSEVSQLMYIGSASDRAEAQAVLRLADAAFNDHQHTRVENEARYGLLSRYATDTSRGAACTEHSLELLSAHLDDTEGYIWAKYTSKAYDSAGNMITGSSDIYSLWKVEKDETRAWIVTDIKEHP